MTSATPYVQLVGRFKRTSGPQSRPVPPFPTSQEMHDMEADRTIDIEQDIRDAMGNSYQAPDAGELSSLVIRQRFEEGAIAMEQMAADLMANLKQNESQTIELVIAHERVREQTQQAVDQCKRTADAYRREAELHGGRIKAASDLAGRVKQTCEELSGQITSS